MKLLRFFAALGSAVLLALSMPARAAGDHGHDHGDAPATAAAPAPPRFAAVSESFELVGVLDGARLTLFLDRYADNSPVPGAQIEIEIGTQKLKAEPQGEAEYLVTLAAAPGEGLLPVTATVTVGDEVDLLAGELDIHLDTHADEAPHVDGWQRLALWAVVGVAVAAAVVVVGRRTRTARMPAQGGAA